MSAIPPPKLNSYVAGATSPQANAYINSQNASVKLNNLNNTTGGSRRRRRSRNQYGGNVTVPVLQTAYAPVSSQSTGSSQVQLAKVGGQNTANSTYDNLGPQATIPKQVGGCKGGGGKWGCYSGGRKTRKRKTRGNKKRKIKRRRTMRKFMK